jgi:winged helix-turn-helix
LNPFCEPQLGRRNLYRPVGGIAISEEISARLWVLNLSDGAHSLLDIAVRSDLPFTAICDAAELLFENKLLAVVNGNASENSIRELGAESGSSARQQSGGQEKFAAVSPEPKRVPSK